MFWISKSQWAALDAEKTNAHRVGTSDAGWIERFGDDYLISAPSAVVAEAMQRDLEVFCERLEVLPRRIFFRKLVKQPGEIDVPVLLGGLDDLSAQVLVLERGLRAMVDFEAGYSVGWFCDQRLNRAWLESELRPQSILNCFAYTGAFSLAAARVGAQTTSVDLSKKSLSRARANFELNGWESDQHRFIADDVFSVLPRFARRGERYDTVILDPPTFSRGANGRVFRVEKNFVDLIELVIPLLNPAGWILLSTNARTMDIAMLRSMAHSVSSGANMHVVSPPTEYPYGSASSTIWVQPTI